MLVFSALSVLFAASGTLALPTRRPLVFKRDNNAAVSTISSSQKSDIGTYAEYVRASYCSPSIIADWSCGDACSMETGVTVIANGGDDSDTPYWYVAYSSNLNSIIVVHQGTTTSSFTSDLEDVKIDKDSLDQTYFPGVDSSYEVHKGFQETFVYTASSILSAVKSGVSTYGTSNVLCMGHSLGAAIATLDSLYLKYNDASLSVSARVFGLPRVGNSEFSTYYTSVIPDSWHVTNMNDPVPRLPGTFLGFEQIEGEIWISTSGVYESCPGLENENCAYGQSVFDFDESEHDGPYDGVYMGADYCSSQTPSRK